MQVEHLFVETLIDIDRKMANNPSEYDLLRVAGLLRPILLDKPPFLDVASKTASVGAKFVVVRPAPVEIPNELKRQMDAAWAKLHETRPEIKRVDVAVSLRFDLLSGEAREAGDQVIELSRQEFLDYGVGFVLNDFEYSVESMLRVAANSLGGIHNDGKPNRDPRAEELRQYMEQGGASWCGRSMPAAMIFQIARCTLRACKPVADGLVGAGLCSPGPSEWLWSADGSCTVRSQGM